MCAVGSPTTERVTQYVGEQGKENRWPEDQPRGGAQDAQRPQPTWLSSKRGLAAVTGERLEIERLTSRSEEGRWKSTHRGNSLAAYPTVRTVLNGGDEETGLCRPRLVATQPSLLCWQAVADIMGVKSSNALRINSRRTWRHSEARGTATTPPST